MLNQKKSQVWIETVIYTLIGLAIMGLIIAVMTPKINQMTDKTILIHSTESLTNLNQQIFEVLTSAGNQRQALLNIKKGEYVIDSLNNSIYFLLKSTGLKYSQPDFLFNQGEVDVLTIDKGNKKYDVYLFLNYSSLNITFNNKKINKQLTSSPTAYKILIQNQGNKQLNFELI